MKEKKGITGPLVVFACVALVLIVGVVFALQWMRGFFTWSDMHHKYGDLFYGISDGVAIVYDVDANFSGELVIPETLDGHPVYAISNYAFQGTPGLTAVTVPDTVQIIGSHAFRNCRNLKRVTVGAFVRLIEDQAFYGCTSLEQICFRGKAPQLQSQVFGLEPGTKGTPVTVVLPPDSTTYTDEFWAGWDRSYIQMAP